MLEKIVLGFGNRDFADGRSLGEEGSDFVRLPLTEQLGRMSRSHACPSVYEVIELYTNEYREAHPETTDEEARTAGMEMALKRYAECNFVWGYILNRARVLNPDLFEQMSTPVERVEGERSNPDLDPALLPEGFEKEMRFLSTPMAFFIPRAVIEQYGRGENNSERTAKRIQKALEVIDKLLPKHQDPISFGIALAEKMAKMDADPRMVVYHIMSGGILKEEGCVTMFKRILKQMKRGAPTLWRAYRGMTTEERRKREMIDPADLEQTYLALERT